MALKELAGNVLATLPWISPYVQRGAPMKKEQKAPSTRRIDLSKTKLLSPYGRNAADALKVGSKVGAASKVGLSKLGLSKAGLINNLRPVASEK